MATTEHNTVEQLLDAAAHLDPAAQRRLLDGLSALVTGGREPKRSITELQGLGRQVWKGIDAQAYVNAERDSWSG